MRGNEVVAAARAWLGTPYRHQAATRGAGCDCLGLVRGVWRTLYGNESMELPNYRADWRDGDGGMLEAAEQLLVRASGDVGVGQVLLFRLGRTPVPKHCGIALGRDRFIHAQEGLGVVEANLTDGWRRRLVAQFDFP